MPISKRLLDLAVIFIFAPLWLPIGLIVALFVALVHGAPVFFTHVRPGLHGQPFTLYKFRTMNNAKDENGTLRKDEIRLTRFGRFLRATSLDEIPELYNVLRGEMSLVGPRPLLMQYLERYNDAQARRHESLPGITGWAQVNGRNNVSWQDKFALDVWYVDHWSLWLDIKILLMTIPKVLLRVGINQPGNATAKEFMGNEDAQANG